MRNTVHQTLRFGACGDAHEAQVSGWSGAEDGFCWTVGPRSALCVPTPPAPHGFALELDCAPYIPDARVQGQPLVVSVDGAVVGVHEYRRDERVAFLCPPPDPDRARTLIEFAHPACARPADHGEADFRPLALSFRRIRILIRLDPPPPQTPAARAMRIRVRSPQAEGLAARAEAMTGQPLSATAGGFEIVAGNCDMGLALRWLGHESLSLLRFAGAAPATAQDGIEDGFARTGERMKAELAEAEWMVRDETGLYFHTNRMSTEVDEATMLREFARHVRFMRRKLLEDLAEAEKIFVLCDHLVLRPLAAALPLFLSLNRDRAPGTLARMLWVCPDDREMGGSVEEVLPGLMRGCLDVFTPPLIAGHIAVGGWLDVLCAANALREA